MKITCPTCAAAYDVPAERLAGGRTVQCARCRTGWVPLADEEAPDKEAPEPPPAPAPVILPSAAFPTLPDPKPRVAAPAAPFPPIVPGNTRPRFPVFLAWAASLALLGALAWAMVAWRADVMRAWPPSERLYAALGLLRR